MTIIATIAYLYLPYLSAFNVSLSDTKPTEIFNLKPVNYA